MSLKTRLGLLVVVVLTVLFPPCSAQHEFNAGFLVDTASKECLAGFQHLDTAVKAANYVSNADWWKVATKGARVGMLLRKSAPRALLPSCFRSLL